MLVWSRCGLGFVASRDNGRGTCPSRPSCGGLQSVVASPLAGGREALERSTPPATRSALAPAVANTAQLAVESLRLQGKDHRADLAFDRPHRCCDSPPCLSIPGTPLSEVRGGAGVARRDRSSRPPLQAFASFFSALAVQPLELLTQLRHPSLCSPSLDSWRGRGGPFAALHSSREDSRGAWRARGDTGHLRL